MAQVQGEAGCSGETTEFSSVLLVSDQYATSEDCGSISSRQVAQTLTGAGRKVYSTILKETEEDRKCAEADGVELILPTCNDGDTREPCLDWLTFDHLNRYPRLPQDAGWIVGHAGVTSRAAATIKEQRLPQASLSLVTQTIPEDTEKYKEEEKAMGIGEKEDLIRQDAEKADTVFSVGHRTHDYFTNTFRAIPKDKRPTHYLFLPKPSDMSQKTTVEYFETTEKVVLLISRVTTVERVKGLDLAVKALSKVVERSQDRIRLRIHTVSKEEFQFSKDILQTSFNSGKLIPTFLPHGTQEDICRDMQQAHLVLMPSRAEPFGLVGLEAMAAGVPVLISDQSGLATLVTKVVPEFHHSIVGITGDDCVDVGRWAYQIEKVLRMSEAEFRRASELKQKLLESKYWEESHQQFLQACGGAGHVAEAQKGKSGAALNRVGETSTDEGLRNRSNQGSLQHSTGQLKRKREDGEEFPVKKKPAPGTCREEGFQVGGVQKYFYYVKEKVSSDWKDVALHLGVEQADIDNIEGRNRDDKSCCMDLLEEWLKGNRERATIEGLMEALIKANLQSVVDGLTKEFPGKKFLVPVGASGTVASSVNLTDLFQRSVKKYYELKLTHFKPLIWNDDFTLSLSDIFTQLDLKQTKERQIKMPRRKEYRQILSGQEEQRKELKSLDNLFEQNITGLSTVPRCILIEGEAGGGKTTFLSKEALDAVSQKTELGRRHNIVLLIPLREVREEETIEEIVCDQYGPETTEGIDAQSIRKILQSNESRVLFLLDGYDELRPEAKAAGQAIPKLLSGKLYPNSTIVITSRPSAGVQQHTRPDCRVCIMGFSPEHVEKHVRKYFSITEHPELADDFIKQYFTDDDDSDDSIDSDDDDINSGDDDNTLSDDLANSSHEKENTRSALVLKDDEIESNLIKTPMFLMLLCLLWEENQEMVSTATRVGLYDKLLTSLVRKYCEREGVDMPTEGLPTEVAESLLQLGKLAQEALLRNETLLDVTLAERENLNWQSLLKLGVVSLEVSSSRLHPRKQLNFSHKTMQEFLAGRYVTHAQASQDIVELLQLTSISKALELGNLLQFTCGCDSQAAQAVMEGLCKLSRREFTHLQPEQFEISNVPMNGNMQKSCDTYEEFVHLCLNILSERQEPEVLQGFSKALPVVVLNSSINRKEATALKYYIQNLHSANLPDRLMLRIHGGTDSRDPVQYLQQCFTTSLPGLRFDLGLSGLCNSDQTARMVTVLKNVPCLRALDLSRSKLTTSTLQPLVQGLRHMSLLEELDLTLNIDFGDGGLELLHIWLSSVPHLAVLRLRLVEMTALAVGMSSLAPYMRHLVGLKELDICGDNCIRSDTWLESLTDILCTFTALQVLGLTRTRIFPTGFRTLVPALCKLTRLIKLDISQNDILDSGLECLAAILPYLTALKVLLLSRTRISDRGISSLIKALPHLVQLQVLDVSFNRIGDWGIASLVQTLCQPSSVDKEQNPPGDRGLTTAPHYDSRLQELYIGGNEEVTGAGLGSVAQLISTLPALTYLDMSGAIEYTPDDDDDEEEEEDDDEEEEADTPAHPYMSDTAAMDLAEALSRLPALERLDLGNISMEPAGFQAVMQAAEEHTTLEELLYSRDLLPEGVDTTASCLVLTDP
ncbi:PREDICTED: uncharacterized protein LOC109477793 [Branchiostoma belcheri]|uniref:Uncharacterized protein LOC109477793 n=1 Tax=Branchiostoma belcheri TaxID=7741 RepID=A0A6P4ZDG4_BRABE|nr:PREDICTED: uncharacterized protein LOC109477793 [Branchiostoma belcheri]